MAEDKNTITGDQLLEINNRLHALEQENQALKEQLQANAAPAKKEKVKLVIPDKTFKVNGKKYRFHLPKFYHEGKEVTAKDALTDSALLEALVEKNVSFVREVA